MGIVIKRILFYAAIVIIVFFISWNLPIKQHQKQTVPWGNVLAQYFYLTNTDAVTDNKSLALLAIAPGKILNNKLRAFYQKLDWSLQANTITYRSSGDASWNQLNTDGSQKKHYLQYWQKVRPLAKELYYENSAKQYVQDPVVHFRCSDAPFLRHNQYHLTRSSSVRWMAEQIKNKGFEQIILLSCNAHNSLDDYSCEKYIEYYSNIFISAGLTVKRQCRGIYEDFFTMVYSPLLVSLNSSSFSFMAGIAKDPADYISCNMGIEVDGVYYLQSDVDWTLDSNPPLLHRDVRDYHDVVNIINRLDG